jgi:hypothetical protein
VGYVCEKSQRFAGTPPLRESAQAAKEGTQREATFYEVAMLLTILAYEDG